MTAAVFEIIAASRQANRIDDSRARAANIVPAIKIEARYQLGKVNPVGVADYATLRGAYVSALAVVRTGDLIKSSTFYSIARDLGATLARLIETRRAMRGAS